MMRTITLFLLIPLALATLGINLWMNLSIRKGIEAELTLLTGLDTKLAYSSLSFLSGAGGLGPMEMRVQGEKGTIMLQVRGFKVDLAVTSLFSEHLEIEEIEMEHAVVLASEEGREYLRSSLPARLREMLDKKTGVIPDLTGNAASVRSYSVGRFTSRHGEIRLPVEKKNRALPDITLETFKPAQPAAAVAVVIADALNVAVEAALISQPAAEQ